MNKINHFILLLFVVLLGNSPLFAQFTQEKNGVKISVYDYSKDLKHECLINAAQDAFMKECQEKKLYPLLLKIESQQALRIAATSFSSITLVPGMYGKILGVSGVAIATLAGAGFYLDRFINSLASTSTTISNTFGANQHVPSSITVHSSINMRPFLLSAACIAGSIAAFKLAESLIQKSLPISYILLKNDLLTQRTLINPGDTVKKYIILTEQDYKRGSFDFTVFAHEAGKENITFTISLRS